LQYLLKLSAGFPRFVHLSFRVKSAFGKRT
jgi:hypothetical protein